MTGFNYQTSSLSISSKHSLSRRSWLETWTPKLIASLPSKEQKGIYSEPNLLGFNTTLNSVPKACLKSMKIPTKRSLLKNLLSQRLMISKTWTTGLILIPSSCLQEDALTTSLLILTTKQQKNSKLSWQNKTRQRRGTELLLKTTTSAALNHGTISEL